MRPTQLPRGLARHSADASMFAPGDRIAERYRVDRLLGRGGMGEVYDVEDEELGVSVALKALRLDLALEPRALRSLKQEVLLARSITHPHVCRVYDLGRHGDEDAAVWFLTMELLRGETLSKRLDRRGRLPEAEALPLVEQMVAGLSAAHRAGVVHLDFKSGNVMVVASDSDRGERAVVTDFGLARLAAEEAGEISSPSAAAGLTGTPEYMSPEQVEGLKAGPAADIYALGVVLYELVTGRLPFSGGTPQESAARRLQEPPPPPRSVVAELDETWERVILRCLARDPVERFDRAELIADALLGRGAAELESGVAGTAKRVRFRLPEERDAFVGRRAELSELERRLAGGAQLVTLLGAAGMGKTRLVTHYAWQSLSAWPGGVWFCDLTGARSVDGIASSVARALGVPLGRVDPVVQLGHAIAGRGRCLVILDTFDQGVEYAEPTLGQWLARAPEARFVVTSRERLKLAGEEIQAVEPLETHAGVALFIERVKRQRPGFDPHGRELESVHEVVEWVEGMPLAIELAAARVRVMTVDQVLERMRERWRVLGGGGEGRHGSLLAAIDESWDLLQPWEKSAWAQCSVFEGGFTLDAAETVLDLHAWPEGGWVVDVLQTLVDKSLLRMGISEPSVAGEAPRVRFGMYLSLQEYARRRLEEMGEPAEGAEERHGAWYAAYGGEAPLQNLEGKGGVARRRELELEFENLVAACRRGASRGHGAAAAAAYCAACTVLQLRGPLASAIDLGRTVLAADLESGERTRVLQSLGDAERICGKMQDSRSHQESALALARETGNRSHEGRILCSLGTLNLAQGRVEEARTDLAAALLVLREVGDQRFEAAALGTLGILTHRQGLFEEGRAHCEAALAIHRQLGHRRLEGTILGNLGTLHREQGRMEEARMHFEAALAIHREMGDRAFEGTMLGNLGSLYQEQGRGAEALEHYEAALSNLRDVGDRLTEGIILGNLGILHLEQGRMDEARARYEEALAIARDLENRRLEGIWLGNLGNLHRAEGRAEEARVQYEAALATLRQLGDRRGEGIFLASLGTLHREQGRLESASEVIARGETLLRDVGDPLELGKLLCARAELERDTGAMTTARATLSEAAKLAQQGGAGPESELGRRLDTIGQTLGLE